MRHTVASWWNQGTAGVVLLPVDPAVGTANAPETVEAMAAGEVAPVVGRVRGLRRLPRLQRRPIPDNDWVCRRPAPARWAGSADASSAS